MSRPPTIPRVSTIDALLRVSRKNGATSVTLADGTTIRFTEDAPSTVADQSPPDDWKDAEPL